MFDAVVHEECPSASSSSGWCSSSLRSQKKLKKTHGSVPGVLPETLHCGGIFHVAANLGLSQYRIVYTASYLLTPLDELCHSEIERAFMYCINPPSLVILNIDFSQ